MHEWYRAFAFLAAATLVVVLSTRTATTSTGTDVVTYHNDVARTGQNLNESILTPTTVTCHVRQDCECSRVDGKVDAQPLLPVLGRHARQRHARCGLRRDRAR